MNALRPSLILIATMTMIMGLVYPSSVWLIGNLFFQEKADGSLIFDKGHLIGSKLIGQHFTRDKYFWSRPSMPAETPYAFIGSIASNMNPANPALIEAITERIELLSRSISQKGPVPADLVTTSASGLDPNISPEAAIYQIQRVSQARGIDEKTLEDLINRYTNQRTFGFIGERSINVLEINLALDHMEGLSP